MHDSAWFYGLPKAMGPRTIPNRYRLVHFDNRNRLSGSQVLATASGQVVEGRQDAGQRSAPRRQTSRVTGCCSTVYCHRWRVHFTGMEIDPAGISAFEPLTGIRLAVV